jgi:glucose/arabinose dehydrogenase
VAWAAVLLVASSTVLHAQIRAETIARGFVDPIAVVAHPADRSALLIVEQGGRVRVLRDGEVLDEPFLDLRDHITAGGERGLLGFAFAPDAAESRRFFVNFTNRNGDTVVSRFRTTEDNPLRADPSSRSDLRWPDSRRFIEQPFSNHNGGHLAFGPEGFLYIGMGDGGSGGDPFNHAQNPQTLLGKMLRIDVNVPDEDETGYRVPESNPFVDQDPIRALGEIWAFGLRNPWRYSFDDWTREGTGALLMGDVGQNAREEINFERRDAGGRNYGWRVREGRQPYDGRGPTAFLPLTEPIHDYPRSIGASVTGGLVYRGIALDPSMNGRYFFADFVSGRVFSLGLHLSDDGDAEAGELREHTAALGGRDVLGMVSTFGVDHDGEILVANYMAGTIVRVIPDPAVAPTPPEVQAEFADEEVHLTLSAPSIDDVVSFLVELTAPGQPTQRIDVGRRTLVTVAVTPEMCVRVRTVGRFGVGPPSSRICR